MLSSETRKVDLIRRKGRGLRSLLVVVFLCWIQAIVAQTSCCQSLRTKGQEAFNNKDYTAAVKHWTSAQKCSDAANCTDLDVLIKKAQAEQQEEQSAAVQKLENDMVPVIGGTFTMGWESASRDGSGNSYEKPAHDVTLRNFSIGRYEVTQAQWRAVMGSDPQELYNKGCDQCPVEKVSWNDIQDFLKKLNQLTGKRYRLPSEAEWEYAARGGNQSRGFLYSGSNNIDEVAWYFSNYKAGNTYGEQTSTRPVGGKEANELGLFDMSGNVWEWCEDDWHDNYQDAPTDGRAWVDSPRGSGRVIRGGSWYPFIENCRAANRYNGTPARRDEFVGFRLALQ